MGFELTRPAAVAYLQSEMERQALIGALRAHPQWHLADLEHVMTGKGPFAEQLSRITISDLLTPPDPLQLDPLIDQERLTRAQALSGDEFDAVVLEVVAEAGERWVASGHVKTRVGGPRWKLQQSLGRLVDAGRLERRGTTSATQYRRVRRRSR